MENILNSLLKRQENDYKTSEQLFIDVWKEYNCPKEITNKEDIYNFLNSIIKKSNGLVIFDQFELCNYDYIESIEMKDVYTLLIWKNLDKFRLKYLNNTLTESEKFEWLIMGYATYTYSLIHINKIKFIKLENHLWILLLSNYIKPKNLEKVLLSKNTLISKDFTDMKMEYMFWEGDEENVKKHICQVHSLPFYSSLIQPKENEQSTFTSRKILFTETLKEIDIRLNKVSTSLTQLNDHDYDEICAKGNAIRRILEYSIKYFSTFLDLKIDIFDKYGHLQLGELEKSLRKTCNINLSKNIIKMANELSHDSGEIYEKEDVLNFLKNSKELILNLRNKININNFNY